jgi:hypothetical protein
VGADGQTFSQINRDAFLDALDADGPSNELRDIAWGYYNVVNSSDLFEVSFVKSTDPGPAKGLDPNKHAPFINFLNRVAPTMANFNSNYGGQVTPPTNIHKYLIIHTSDANPTLGDYVSWVVILKSHRQRLPTTSTNYLPMDGLFLWGSDRGSN